MKNSCCKNCHGFVYNDANDIHSCASCGEEMLDDDYEDYYPEEKISDEILMEIEDDLFNNLDHAIETINGLLDKESDDDNYDVIAQLRIPFIQYINRILNYYNNYPFNRSDFEFTSNVAQEVTKIVNTFKSIEDGTKKRIKRNYGISYAALIIDNYISDAVSREESDWNTYLKNSDNINLLFNTCLYAVKQANALEAYGSADYLPLYKTLDHIFDLLLNTTYPHEYWLYDYKKTEYIGLRDDLRKKAQNDKERFAKRAEALENFHKDHKKEVEAKLKEEREKLRVAKIDSYWASHRSEYLKLTKDRSDLMNQINKIKRELGTKDLLDEFESLKSERTHLQDSLKRAKRYGCDSSVVKQINGLITEINNRGTELNKLIGEKEKELADRVNALNKEVSKIDTELTKDR